MSLDDIVKLVQTLGFPILVAVWFMRRDERVNVKLREQNNRMIRALALIAQALEAKEAMALLDESDNGRDT